MKRYSNVSVLQVSIGIGQFVFNVSTERFGIKQNLNVFVSMALIGMETFVSLSKNVMEE